MPSITTVHESLPYVDPEPSQAERAAAEALITAERALVPDDPFHALLPQPAAPNKSYLTPLLQAEFDRIATHYAQHQQQETSQDGQQQQIPPPPKLQALDLSRYEAPDPPTPEELSKMSPDEAVSHLSSALSQAYVSHAYISARRAHLALLDSYGKNAWLVGNYHLEGELKAIERELAEARRQIDVVTLQRRNAQGEAGPEIQGLEETWRKGVGRVLETEAAAESLRRQVLEARRRL